ncbi:MAG: HEPN domain-containing protein [Candidatus Aenigmatarchaeota archaeon]
MAKLDWCKRQKHGIKKVEPSENIAEEYIENAEESLRVLKKIRESESKVWLATTKYYIEYFALYALMMRIGLKSEIHDCSIEIANWLHDHGILPEEIVGELEDSKELRIENQYYLKNKDVEIDPDELRDFILRMREIKDSLSKNDVSRIRSKIFS